jgi:hypothetical protein
VRSRPVTLALLSAVATCLSACSTEPTAPLADITGHWRLSLMWAVPGGQSCSLDDVALNLRQTAAGQPIPYSADLTGGSGTCTANGQTTPIQARPRTADSVFYAQGSFRMVIGQEHFTGVSVGAHLSGHYSEQLAGTPSQQFLVTGTWSATLNP